MYIISKHKDFYDGVAGQKGIDKTIIFERHIGTYNFNVQKKGDRQTWWRLLDFPVYGPRSSRYSYYADKVGDKNFTLFVVGFCGKIYVCAQCATQVKDDKFSNTRTAVSYIYGLDKIKEAICDYYEKPEYFNSVDKNLNYIQAIVNDPAVNELFYTYNTPHFILTKGLENNLHVNGILKDIEFFKVMDPFMAFQEIEMYITGVLGTNNKPVVEISDKHKIVGHGFDPKYSFRKEPEDKKK